MDIPHCVEFYSTLRGILFHTEFHAVWIFHSGILFAWNLIPHGVEFDSTWNLIPHRVEYYSTQCGISYSTQCGILFTRCGI